MNSSESCREVWLIDDSVIDNYINTRLLEKSSFSTSIKSFESSVIALETLKKRFNEGLSFPDWVFLDLNMPELSGFDFLASLKNFNLEEDPKNHIKVAILSSTIDEYEKKRSLELGGHCFISKPLRKNDIDSLAPNTH